MIIYVTAPEGRRIYGYGSRQMGESFEVPDEVAQDLIEQGGFSPGAPDEEIPAQEIWHVELLVDESPVAESPKLTYKRTHSDKKEG